MMLILRLTAALTADPGVHAAGCRAGDADGSIDGTVLERQDSLTAIELYHFPVSNLISMSSDATGIHEGMRQC